MVKTLKFNRPLRKLAVAKGQSQGLRSNKVNLRGNQPDSKFKYLTPPSVSFPDDDPSARLARGEDASSVSSGSSLEETRGGGGGGKSRFDKIANRYNKKKQATKGKSEAPARRMDAAPAFQRRASGVTSAPPPIRKVVPPADISDSEGDFSDSDDGGSISSYSSYGSSPSLAQSLSSDASSSIFSTGRPPAPSARSRPAAAKSGNVFNGMSSSDAEEAEKADLLARFHFLKQKTNDPVHLSKNYTAKSSLNEMRMEMGRIEHEAQVKRSIKINQRFLLAGMSLVENTTNNYGPKATRGKLYKVSQFVDQSIHDYDSAFERMSEEYGGLVGAITGGNPLYEIGCTALYHMFIYAMFYRGAESAQANDELTIEDIRKRFPDLVKEAGAQYAREQHMVAPAPPPQQQQQPFYQQIQPQQQQQQMYQQPYQPHAAAVTGQGYPPMSAPMAPPSDGLLSAYMQHQREHGGYGGQQQRSMLNTEDPTVLAHLSRQSAAAPQQPMQQAQPDRPPVAAAPDLMIAEMHQPLPRAPQIHDEQAFPEEDGIMNTAVSTQLGRPPKITPVPTLAEKMREQQARPEEFTLPPVPSDEYGEFSDDGLDEGRGEGEIVIDIN